MAVHLQLISFWLLILADTMASSPQPASQLLSNNPLHLLLIREVVPAPLLLLQRAPGPPRKTYSDLTVSVILSWSSMSPEQPISKLQRLQQLWQRLACTRTHLQLTFSTETSRTSTQLTPFWTSAGAQSSQSPQSCHPSLHYKIHPTICPLRKHHRSQSTSNGQLVRGPLSHHPCPRHSCHQPCQPTPLTRTPWCSPWMGARRQPTLTRPSSPLTDGRGKRTACRFQLLSSPSPGTLAQNVARTTPPAPIWAGTSRPTGAWTQPMPRSATSVARCTSRCQLCRCTSSRTTSTTSVTFAARLSPDPGCCKVTWGHIQATSRTAVLTVESHLRTDPIWEHTCKRTRLSRTSSASVATSPSPWSPTWTNTTSQHASRTSPFPP